MNFYEFWGFLLSHCPYYFFHVVRLIDVISKLGLQKGSVLRHMSSVIQPILEKGIVDHSIIHRALMEYLSIADKVIFLPAGVPCFFSTLFLPFPKPSLLAVICCRSNPAVIRCTPCSNDPYQGWIQDWVALHQTWECKGLCKFGQDSPTSWSTKRQLIWSDLMHLKF